MAETGQRRRAAPHHQQQFDGIFAKAPSIFRFFWFLYFHLLQMLGDD